MSNKKLQTTGGTGPRFMAILSYLGILCIVPLLFNRRDEYVYFHARQGLVIWMFVVIAIFVFFVPGIGKETFSLFIILEVVYSLGGILSVILNRAWKLPIVHSLSMLI
jgi:fumarate reductase subunit D